MKLLPDNIKPDKYLGKGIEFLSLFISLILIIFVVLIFAIFYREISLGDFGSILSGTVGTMVALLVAVLTFLAFYVQYDANKKIQNQFKVQQGESQFYKMLDLHVKNVEAFSIQNFIITKKTIVERGTIDGRRIFLPLVKEFHFILDAVYLVYDTDKRMQRADLNKLAYQIFFYGLKSNHVKPLTIVGDSNFNILKKKLLDFQELFRDEESKSRILVLNKNTKIKLNIRYVPFSGHESRLAHYYRHLYQTVKQVVQLEKSGLITYLEARKYLATLRAQLSNEEQQLLYYNYRVGFGKKWDLLGKTHKFFTDYRMIHNIPLDDGRLSDTIENPRLHFEKYIISNSKKESDPLFEWGD